MNLYMTTEVKRNLVRLIFICGVVLVSLGVFLILLDFAKVPVFIMLLAGGLFLIIAFERSMDKLRFLKYSIIVMLVMGIERVVDSIIRSSDSLSIHELLYLVPPILVFFLRRRILSKEED